jgi:hypothetical protein
MAESIISTVLCNWREQAEHEAVGEFMGIALRPCPNLPFEFAVKGRSNWIVGELVDDTK